MVDTNQEMKPKTNRRTVSRAAVLAAQRGVPAGTYCVDAEALRKAASLAGASMRYMMDKGEGQGE